MKNKTSAVGAVICIAAAVIALVSLLFLPPQIPISWGTDGSVSYAPKQAILIIGILPAFIFYGLGFLKYIDPKKENYKKFESAFNVIRVLVAVFLFLMQLFTIISAFWPDLLSISAVVTSATGLLICLFGNYMPKLKHNFFCGIKTPWTLSSEECWTKTHRFAGKIWFAGGLSIFIAAFCLTGAALLYFVLGICIGVLVLVPSVYSYIIFRRQQP